MRNIFTIGHNDLRLFLKRKSAFVWLFLIPLAFVYFMGFANRGAGDPSNRKPEVLIENLDTNFLGRVFMDELSAQNMSLLDPTNRETASRIIRIPADFSAKILQHQQSKVEFLKRSGSDAANAAIIQLRLFRALIAMNGHILEVSTGSNSNEPLTEAALREVMAIPNPVKLKASFTGRQPVPSGFNFSLPGNLVMYVMMNLLIFGGTTLASERNNGVIKRMFSSPVRRLEIVLGKIYGLLLLGLAQITFFLLVGKFLFHVNLGANLPGVLIILMAFAWVAASLGVLVGSLLAAADRVSGICVLASLLLASLGGCWWPLELASPALRSVALFTPTGWALKALHQLISFGSGFEVVLVPLAVLLAFGAAATWLAARYFRS